MNRILITEGDPCGIGPELVQISSSKLKSIAKKFSILYVHSQTRFLPSGWKSVDQPSFPSSPGMYSYCTNRLSEEEQNSLKVGVPSKASGKSAFASLECAVKIQKESGAGLVTLPLSKEWVLRSGQSKFVGHTEYLAEMYHKKTFMLMSGKELNVLPLTTHVPLVKVPFYLKKIDLSSLISAIRSLPLDPKKQIGFLGLNPHAGEGGKVGNEEKKILMPMITKLQKAGLPVSGPLPADAAFSEPTRSKYSLFLACYHDQGLVPFKMWEGKFGINLTLGLEFPRVSPDHGTAFDIAGKKIADPKSFHQCLDWVTQNLAKWKQNLGNQE
ncbi:4-hydroxythreonine-4-phosphate dehydrogenase [Leptospira perolatii]|uniref:4-hydroxythreonine-4-phosphate dehydrogenase n=1 Tax=Leptospira perolatii TaxID=2023191 RepID=A0A2M9ZK25_9LEPT|nr:4-hydroxythreonine-4-phosphate dehydrogenase PdxA [Leptospira perolatii]PJZ69226.1 4-hydroxythreonine-4-phosphate dehydrogenase [Leptospira perolatii]PJZ72392.1 4-hydroxythreonine-4-phosphate dehydrogenase [Leptospira perolatii]